MGRLKVENWFRVMRGSEKSVAGRKGSVATGITTACGNLPGVSSSATEIVNLLARGIAASSTQGIVPLHSRGGMADTAFQSASNTPRGVTSAFQGALNPPRQRFYVELKDGEANVVSWKKLLKDALKDAPPIVSEAPAGANPALEARIAPDRAGPVQEPLPPPPSRFSSVIEKIERLYQGGGSDDEESDVSPDDSQYDTEDDFIDDSELNEYFSVEKAKTKHTGFFVNRGKLEKINEVPAPAPAHVPRKRKWREMKTVAAEKIVEESAKKRLNTSIRLKDAARKSLVSQPVDGAPSSPPTLHRGSEQPKLKKRLKPIQDERDKSAEQHLAAPVEDDSEVLKVAKVEDTKREARKAPVSIVELSDDENEGEEVSKRAAVNESGMEDSPEKHVPRPQESDPAVEASADDSQSEDSARETKTPVITPKASSPTQKEASPGKRAGWPKGTVLERAIHDLEKGVAESFPFRGDKEEKMRAIEVAEAEGGKSKRMPREVKQKLAKVARLAARQGKISDELIDRLMTILGHVMRLRTLKRNLKAMVELGMTAKHEKDVRLLSMKREVTELVKSRVSHQAVVDPEQREGSSDDFQSTPGTSERGAVNGRYKWDHATEDRICDLYDQYVEGMDEHKGPQIRKLYLELAELWPEGWMDNHGIKNAVFRAKERQKKQNKLKMGEEKRRRKEALMSEKKHGDTVVERLATSSTQPFVPPPARAPASCKEKLTIKSSSKQRVHESSRRVDEDNRRLDEVAISRHVEEIRRLVVEEKRRAAEQRLEDRATKRTDDSGANRENGSHSSLYKEKQKIRLEDGLKVRRGEDLLSVKRKLPRKSYEGKIIEQSAKKSVKKEISDSYGGSSHNLLNSPLIRLKRKKLKPAEGKPYPSLRLSPPPASKAERYQNSNPSSSSRPLYTDRMSLREERLRELREDRSRESLDRPRETPDRHREVARWPAEASRVHKD
ncbi:hypothetical protein R1flu_010139 [Riccia fluitans]|uniref:Hpc2-related domain-containing protein n=1 Tax=Riccia fluitans TaxID=41844 RepID=A0ABD1Z455_9MARC